MSNWEETKYGPNRKFGSRIRYKDQKLSDLYESQQRGDKKIIQQVTVESEGRITPVNRN